jgi:Flp pilus assembly protein TadD
MAAVIARLGVAIFFAMLLVGCKAEDHYSHSLLGDRELAKARPSDEILYQAKLHYRNGDYGLAEKFYRHAIEANPDSMDAWLGLAASYDRIRRFDLADRAYGVVVQQVGYTPSVLNNLGYHYMLRGDLDQAAKYLNDAAQKDPDNPYVQNNLQLLATWPTSEGTRPRRH